MVFSKFDEDRNDVIENSEFDAWTNQAKNLTDEEKQAMKHKKLSAEQFKKQRQLMTKYFKPSATRKLSLFELAPYSIEWNAYVSLQFI